MIKPTEASSWTFANTLTLKTQFMHLTPKEIDKLNLLTLGLIAERRLNKGLKLNYRNRWLISLPAHWKAPAKAKPSKR